MLLKEIAVRLMEHLCNHDWHGYSQVSRYGDGEGACQVQMNGRTYYLEQGDRDCSSAVISAFEAAGISCGGAVYTGNMRICMVGTGNFRWHPMTDGYIARRGDVYLNEANHTAMCTSSVPDMLAEFSISETGGIDGAEGDQTGRESYIHAYYDYPWDGILECICTATDDDAAPAREEPDELDNIFMPEYRVYTAEDGWLEWMIGLSCSDGCGDDFAGVKGHMHRNAQFKNLGPGGWFQLTMKRQGELPRNQENTDLSDYITGYTIYYGTPEPGRTGYYKAKYRVSPAGRDYLKWEYDDEDGGAGDDANGVDRLQLTLKRS